MMENTPDHGSSVVLAALRTNNPLWKEFFDAGWVNAVLRNQGVRRDFLDAIVYASDTETAKSALSLFLEGKKPADISKMFSSYRRGQCLIAHWLYTASSKEGSAFAANSAKTATALFNQAKSLGLNIDVEIKEPFKRGGVLNTTSLGLVIHESFWNSDDFKNYLEKANILISHGATFTSHALIAVLKSTDMEKAKLWVDHANNKGLATVSDFLTHKGEEFVKPDVISMLLSMSARKTLQDSLGEIKTIGQTKPLA